MALTSFGKGMNPKAREHPGSAAIAVVSGSAVKKGKKR
jgi:hypothetical protein